MTVDQTLTTLGARVTLYVGERAMKRVYTQKQTTKRPDPAPIDTRTPSGRKLPY